MHRLPEARPPSNPAPSAQVLPFPSTELARRRQALARGRALLALAEQLAGDPDPLTMLRRCHLLVAARDAVDAVFPVPRQILPRDDLDRLATRAVAAIYNAQIRARQVVLRRPGRVMRSTLIEVRAAMRRVAAANSAA